MITGSILHFGRYILLTFMLRICYHSPVCRVNVKLLTAAWKYLGPQCHIKAQCFVFAQIQQTGHAKLISEF